MGPTPLQSQDESGGPKGPHFRLDTCSAVSYFFLVSHCFLLLENNFWGQNFSDENLFRNFFRHFRPHFWRTIIASKFLWTRICFTIFTLNCLGTFYGGKNLFESKYCFAIFYLNFSLHAIERYCVKMLKTTFIK